MAAPTLVGEKHATSTLANSVSPAIDSGVQAGDLILCFCTSDFSRDWTATTSGYTQLIAGKVTNHLSHAVFYKISDGSESSFTAHVNTGGSEPMKINTIVIRGWDGQTPAFATNTASSNAPKCPTLTPTYDCLALRLCSVGVGSAQTLTSIPATEIETSSVGVDTNNIKASCSYQTQTGTGAVGTSTYSASSNDEWFCSTIIIQGNPTVDFTLSAGARISCTPEKTEYVDAAASVSARISCTPEKTEYINSVNSARTSAYLAVYKIEYVDFNLQAKTYLNGVVQNSILIDLSISCKQKIELVNSENHNIYSVFFASQTDWACNVYADQHFDLILSVTGSIDIDFNEIIYIDLNCPANTRIQASTHKTHSPFLFDCPPPYRILRF